MRIGLTKQKIFLYLCLAFILGTFIAPLVEIKDTVVYSIIFVAIVLAIIFWDKKVVRFICLAIIIAVIAIIRFNLAIPEVSEKNIAYYNDQEESIVVKGIVSQEPDVRDTQVKLTVEVNEVELVDNQVSGKILVTAPRYPEYYYGDELKISGQLQAPAQIEDFDYGKYLSRYDIYSISYNSYIEKTSSGNGNIFRTKFYNLKSILKDILDKVIPEPQASIFSAMALGLKRGIPSEVREQFSNVGVSHIIAISGLHITIIAGLLVNLALVLSLGRKQAFYFAVIGLFFYIALVGFPASAIRAGIMGFLLLLSTQIGRLNRSLNALVLAAVIMLLINPKLLHQDIGFQLSFLAVLGILFFSPSLEKWLKRLPETLQIKSSVVMSLAAQITTLPIIAYNFQKLSLIAPVANIFILPILPLLMMIGLADLCLGLIWLKLGEIGGWVVWLMLSYLLKIVELLNKVPYAFVEVEQIGMWLIVLYYGTLVLLIYFVRKRERV